MDRYIIIQIVGWMVALSIQTIVGEVVVGVLVKVNGGRRSCIIMTRITGPENAGLTAGQKTSSL